MSDVFSNDNTFSFYVYDLPSEYSVDTINQYLEEWGQKQERYDNKTEFLRTFCDYHQTICNPTNYTKYSQYSTRRMNLNSDSVIANIFVKYHGPLRTYDPNVADLFIVPYPGGTHFYAMLTKHRQNKIKPKLNAVQQILLDPSNGLLPYFNETTKHRHIFLSLNHLGLVSQQPLVTDKVPSYRAGQIVTPQANTNREYQPNTIQQLHTRTFFEQKRYALAAIFSPKISGDSHDRVTFLEQSSKLFGGNDTDIVANTTNTTSSSSNHNNNNHLHLHGLPVKIITLTEKRKLPNEQEVMQIYRDSIFCPCFRGDGPEQKRFIDAILSGCIPVVMSYEWDDGEAEDDEARATKVTTTKPTNVTSYQRPSSSSSSTLQIIF